MDRNDITEFVDAIEKEPELEKNKLDEREEEDSDERYDDEPRTFKLQGKTLLIGGAIVLFIIIIAGLWLPKKSNLSKADFNTLIKRVDRIEAQMTDVEGIEERIAAREKGLTPDITAGGALEQQLDLLTRKVEALEQKMGSVDKKVQAIKTSTAGRVKAKKAQYHVVVRGESLFRIARKYELTVDKLCNLNKITRRQSIYPGQKLLVSTANGS